MPETSQMPNTLVLSPHLDDAVFGCGELIARTPGTVVMTLLAGVPAGFDKLTEWDAASGFASAREAIAQRRKEDRSALDILGALPQWCDFGDSQYGQTPAPKDIAAVIAASMERIAPHTILFPAGLFHSDHALVHEAAIMLMQEAAGAGRKWLMYEEPSYRRVPGLLQRRLADLASRGIRATPLPAPPPVQMEAVEAAALKHEAVHCYASQLRALDSKVKDSYVDVFAPERYWLAEADAAHAPQE
jgi:LmbE family N-acetylglucosaminyl deacetylase